jgi:transcription termination/antitermination protein NusG
MAEETRTSENEPRASENEAHESHIFVVRTTANREDQVVDFLASNAKQRDIPVYSVIRPHGMRGYIFVEAASKGDADRAAHKIPYAKGVLPQEVEYAEIEQMLEPEKKQDVDIRINDIIEIISGPFKREKAKVIRFDLEKEEVVVNLLEAAVSIPLTLKLDAVKVIRRDQME